jgi:DNA-binding beta-propeller fold protein YncE
MTWARRGSAAAAISVGLLVTWTVSDRHVTGQARRPAQVPIFEYDPTFPKPLPETWAIGPIGGLAVDRRDHLFVVQRRGGLLTNERFSGADDTPPKADCCVPAPPVLELDPTGKLVNSWGGPGAGYDWPQIEHGVWIDGKDNVWLAGSGAKDAQLLKFTHQGAFLQQFGKPGMSGGNDDRNNLGSPANLTIDDATREIYIADGYGNRRVVVLDADTLTFKRMWGGYGNKPEGTNPGPFNPDAPPTQQFRLPHNISISRDGFVYVADRPNNRIQVFRKDGTYVKETFIAKRTFLSGAASGFALSADPQQRFLYMIDGANHHVWILERESLKVVARFGQQGLFGGSLNVPHAIAVDSKGNLYIGENFDARRFQRFLYKGLGTPVAGANPPTTILE